MWDVKACRGCLANGVRLEKISEGFKRLYTALTGLEFKEADGYPTYLCVECQMQMKKSLAFRRRCRRAYYVMKEIMNVRKQVTLNDIITVNRRRTNLESSLSHWNPLNAALYTINTEPPDIDTLIANIDKDEPEETQYNMVKHEFDMEISKRIFHLNIKSELDQEVEAEEEKAEEEKTDEANEEVTCPEDDANFDDSEQTRDMNDFQDDVSEQDQEQSDTNMKTEDDIKIKKKRGEKLEKKAKKPGIMNMLKIHNASLALANMDLTYLDLDQQKEQFAKKLQEASFKNAMYKCALCVTVFNDMNALMDHLNLHKKSNNSKYPCKVCKVKFTTEEELKTHITEIHAYIYKCKICDDVTLYSMNEVMLHQKAEKHTNTTPVRNTMVGDLTTYYDITVLSTEEMQLKGAHEKSTEECYVCKMRFIEPKALQAHMKHHTVPEKKLRKRSFQCEICYIFAKSKVTLSYHMEAWHMYLYKCKSCDDVMYNRQEAVLHAKKHVPLTSDYPCPYCDTLCKSDWSVWHHCRLYHYSKMYNQHCNLCGESYFSAAKLYNHQLSVHRHISIVDPRIGEEEFACLTCNVKFVTLKAYQMHGINHDHDEAKAYENACLPCKKIFDTSEQYDRHLQGSCKGINRYPRKCPYCDKMMLSCARYFRHHERAHRDLTFSHIRDAKLCELCGQSVIEMSEHMRRHATGSLAAPECAHCAPPLRLPDARTYVAHVLAHHTHKPFVCAICGHLYRTRKECKDHILKLHAPLRPFKCQVCAREFSHSDYLIEHCKKNHDLKINIKRDIKPKKMTKRIYVYPHMKLNLSMCNRQFLGSFKVHMCNYLRTESHVLKDISDYVTFEHTDDFKEEDVMPKKRKSKERSEAKPRKKRVKSELNSEVVIEDVPDVNEPLDIIEENGEQFVNINGILYKIERE